MHTTVLLEASEELAKLLLDVDDDFLLLNPLGEGLLSLTVVVHILHIAHAIDVISIFRAAHLTSVHPSGIVLLA